MSRSGYTDDCEHVELWRANVRRSLGGRRGQAFLCDMATALDAMPVKRLVTGDIVNEDGECCAIGSVALARKMDVATIDESDPDEVAAAFGVARAMVQEIAYENDERELGGYQPETPEQRWTRMRKWVDEKLQKGTR